MKNPTVSNETIVNYLLGSLSEAETERLDELSIADDAFAVGLNAAEKDLVDAYVQDELTGSALEQFRAHYLSSPLRRSRLSFAQALDALARKYPTPQSDTDPEGLHAELATKTKHAGYLRGWSSFISPRPAWGMAVAAIALLLVAGWFALENKRLRRQVSQIQTTPAGSGTREQDLQNELEQQRYAAAKMEQELTQLREERTRLEAEVKRNAEGTPAATGERNAPTPPEQSARAAIASFFLTPQMRGVQQIRSISIPAGTEQMSMQLQLEPNDYRAYRVALINQTSHQELWSSGRLKATGTRDTKTLKVGFQANLLRAEVYVLRVTGIPMNGTAELIGDYPFRVMK